MNPRPNETCTCASACVVKLPRLCAVRLWDLWLSSHLCQWCMERSAPGTAPVTWTDIHWDVTYRCCVTTSVGQSWGSGGGGAGQHRCGEVCVSVCVCAKFSLKPILEMPFLLFMTEEKLWSQRHFQGRACAGNLTCAQLCVHVLLTCVFSHRFAFRCATSRFLWNPLWNPLSSPRKLATSFPTWRVWLSSCVKAHR